MRKKLVIGLATCMLLMLSGSLFTGCETSDECAHTHVSEEIVTAATCTTAGSKQLVCDDCGKDLGLEPIAKLNHDVDLTQAQVTEATCTQPKTFVAQCKREGCGVSVTTTEGEPLGHDYDETRVEANCNDPAKIEYTCKRENCGNHYSEDVEGSRPLGHHYVEKEGTKVDSDCTTAGSVTYVCDRENCGDEYDDIIPALGHASDGAKAEVTAPKCSEKGYTTYHCSVCDVDYKADYVQPTGHELEDGSTVQATCSNCGYKTKTCAHGCGYVERYDVVSNTAHSFDEDGSCTVCGKDAFNVFALACGSDTPFAILKDGSRYIVYSESYTETTVKMPAEVVQALYNAGLYSFDVALGSTTDNVSKSLSIKVNGGAVQYVNASGELKSMGTYTFADANGIFESAKDGITFDVYYRALDYADAIDGADKVTSYTIEFVFRRPFDIEDSGTYLHGAIPYTYNADAEQFTLVATKGDISLRSEWLTYYYNLGYKNVTVEIGGASGQMLSFDVCAFSNGSLVGNSMGNGFVSLPSFELTEDLASYDLLLQIYSEDLYGTAWNPSSPADRVILTVKFTKPMTLETCVYPENKAVSSVTYAEGTGWTITKAVDDNNGYFIVVGREYINARIAEGKKVLRITFDKDNGITGWLQMQVVQNGSWVDLYGNIAGNGGATDSDGNNYFDIDLTAGYDFTNYDVRMVLVQQSAVIKAIDFLDEAPVVDEETIETFLSVAGEGTSVSYDETASTWTLINENGIDVYLSFGAEFITKQKAAGKLLMRVTFDKDNPVTDGNNFIVRVVENGSWKNLYGWQGVSTWMPKDLNENQYFEVDLLANYDYNHSAGSLQMMFRDKKVVIKSIEFFDLDSKDAYFTALGTGTSTIRYNSTNDYFVVTQGTDANVGLSSFVIRKHMQDGATKLRITFTETPVSTTWLQVFAFKNDGSGSTEQLFREWQVSKDADGNEYVEIDLTGNYDFGLGTYIQLVFSQATTNVSLDFITANA